jgi:hypothetical protein
VLVKTVDDGLFGPPKAVTLTPEAQDLLEGKWNSLYAKVMETQLDPADYRDFEQTLRRFKRSAREFDLVPTGADEVTVRKPRVRTGANLQYWNGHMVVGVQRRS